MILGGILGSTTLLLQYYSASQNLWPLYTLSFTLSMLGLNTIYSSMLGLNSDLVPEGQVGVANGVQALLNVLGAMSGMGGEQERLG